MVALAIFALVVLLAHRVFAGVVDGAERLGEAQLALDRESNARRFLHETFGSLDVGLAEGASFLGQPDRVEFTSWLHVPDGWLERRRLILRLQGGRLEAGGDVAIVLREGVERLDIDYLLEAGANEAWVREWVSPVSAPVAVRLRISGARVDTLLLLVGPRG